MKLYSIQRGIKGLSSLVSFLVLSQAQANQPMRKIDPGTLSFDIVTYYWGTAASLLIKVNGLSIARVGYNETPYGIEKPNPDQSAIEKIVFSPDEMRLLVDNLQIKVLEAAAENRQVTLHFEKIANTDSSGRAELNTRISLIELAEHLITLD